MTVKNVSVKIPPLEVEGLTDAQISNYLNENLETAIAELVAQMIDDERKAAGVRGERREIILKRINAKQQASIRDRVKNSENAVLSLELINQKHLLDKKIFQKRKKFCQEFASAC